MTAPRRQCASCPWKVSINPDALPGGYGHVDREAVARANVDPRARMGCHVLRPGPVLPCVGWLVQQLGPGNNIALRVAVAAGRVDGNVETVGPQRATLARRGLR